MIFNTSWFLLFFLTFYFFLWFMPNPKVRFFYLLACSAVFHYHFAGPAGVTPIIIMAVMVGFLLLSILLPMFNLISHISAGGGGH